MQTWHIVHMTGIVQAIYGGALLDMANEKAKQVTAKIWETNPTVPAAIVTTITGTRPKVGDPFIPAATPVPRPSTATVRRSIIRE